MTKLSTLQSAKFVPKGSDIVFEIHYTAVGTVQSSKSTVGLVLAKKRPQLRYITSFGPIGNNLVIEPNDNNGEAVSEITAQFESKLVYFNRTCMCAARITKFAS